jgi:hypothetical protein
MKLWLISQDVRDDYDSFDSAVVVASTEEEARRIQPSQYGHGWVEPEHVDVKFLGEAANTLSPGVVCASFNAG